MKTFEERLFQIVSYALYVAVANWAVGLGLLFIPTLTKQRWAFTESDWFLQFLLYSLVAMLGLLSILIGITCGQKLNQWLAHSIAQRRARPKIAGAENTAIITEIKPIY